MSADMVKVVLRKLLTERGKSMYALAKETGLAYTTLWKLENGDSQGISFEVLKKICLCLNCTPNDLLLILPAGKQRKKPRRAAPEV